jgi:anti-sigma B factor antagonist
MATPEGFSIDVAEGDDRTVVTVRGELDMSNAPSLVETLTKDAGAGRNVAVDLSGVSFIDSSAIGGLVSAGQALADAGGRLQIGPRSDTVARVLEITGLAQGTDAFDVEEL